MPRGSRQDKRLASPPRQREHLKNAKKTPAYESGKILEYILTMDFSKIKTIGLGIACVTTTAFAAVGMDYASYATIETHSGPSVTGAHRALPQNSIGSRLRGGLLIGKSKRVNIDTQNGDEWESVNLDVDFRFSYLPVYGAIDKFVKGRILDYHIGFGISNGIYAGTGIGINTRFFELGVTSFQRFTYQTYDYLGFRINNATDENGNKLDDTEITESNKDKLVLHVGAGAYGSLFIGPITLSYSGDIYRPQKSISVNDNNVDFPFETPYLFTNHFGISYWYSDTVEFQVGINNMLIDFNGGNWFFTAGIALWSF